MLPRAERLCQRKDFLWLQQQGRSFRAHLLRLVVAPVSPDRRLAGFIVSKRISKKATERNRIKRRLRAAYRCFYPQVRRGVSLLFIAQAPIRMASYREIMQQMEYLLKNARVFTEVYAGTCVGRSD